MNQIIPNLTPEQKQCAREVLEIHPLTIAANFLAAPPPAGIGIQLSRATLGRLKQKLELEDQLADRDGVRSSASVVLKDGGVEELLPASIVALTEKAFQLSLSNDPNALQLAGRLLQNVTKVQKSLGLVPSRFSAPIADEQFRLQVAKMVLLHFGEIGSIRGNDSLGQDRKHSMIRDRIFSFRS